MSKIDSSKIALVFPGQGSQVLNMGYDICLGEADAKNTFRLVAEQCDFDLQKTCWVGPEDILKRTIHAQPALYATSAACMQALRRHWTDTPLCVAGHSLGEFSAMWAAGVYSLADGARLTSRRGYLMDQAKAGSMSAVLGFEADALQQICHENGIVIANYNTPQQLVISGDSDKVQLVNEILKEQGVKVIPLPVSGAFHSSLVEPANEAFQEIINSIDFQDAVCPIIQNTTAKAHTAAADIKNNIKNQMISSVYWTQSVETMLAMGVETFIEIGSGKVLSGLIKKIDRNVQTLQVADMDSLKATLEALQAVTV